MTPSTLSVRSRALGLLAVSVTWLTVACNSAAPPAGSKTPLAATSEGARSFLTTVSDAMTRLLIGVNQTGWVAQTFITDDTEAIDARENQAMISAQAQWAKDSVTFDRVEVTPAERRQLNLLKLSLVLAAPDNADRKSVV